MTATPPTEYRHILVQRPRQGGKTALYAAFRARLVRSAWQAQQRPAPAVGPFVRAVGEHHLYLVPPRPPVLPMPPPLISDADFADALRRTRDAIYYGARIGAAITRPDNLVRLTSVA